MNEFATLFLASFVTLLSIVDPLCAAPIFVSITACDDERKKRRQARDAALYMTAILVLFLAAGSFILRFFGISIEGVKIAGGLMMITAAKGMLDERRKLTHAETAESLGKEDVAFSPIAMPLLSGPGAIAVIIGMSSHARDPFDHVAIVLAIVGVAVVSWLTLRLSSRIVGRLGGTLINAMTKLMGFLLLCIAVQFILDGLLSIYATRIALAPR